jgi:hypothetical protein
MKKRTNYANENINQSYIYLSALSFACTKLRKDYFNFNNKFILSSKINQLFLTFINLKILLIFFWFVHFALNQYKIFSLKESIILYDLTNTYFEGKQGESEIKRRGRSKEGKSKNALVTMGNNNR